MIGQHIGTLYASIGLDTARLRKDAAKASKTVGGLDSSFKSLSGSLLNVKTILAGAAAAFATFAARDLWNTQVMVDQVNRAFMVIASGGGGPANARRELDYIRQTAMELGQEFWSLTDSFKFIAAAAKDTALEGQGTRDIFRAVSEAGTALGLTNVQVKMSLYAISQMISKGTVNAEELRQQLGERLPGAYQAMARALGVTTKELNKMLEQGQVIATEAIPKLAKELSRLYSGPALLAADKPIGILNRFKTAWVDFKNEIGSGAFLDTATGSLMEFTELLKDKEFINSIKIIVDDLTDLAKVMVWLVKVTGKAISLLSDLSEIPESEIAGAWWDMSDMPKLTPDRKKYDLSFGNNDLGPGRNMYDLSLTTASPWSDKGMSAKQIKEIEKWSYTLEKLSKAHSDAWSPMEEDYQLLTEDQKRQRDMWVEINKLVLDHQSDLAEAAAEQREKLNLLKEEADYQRALSSAYAADEFDYKASYADEIARQSEEIERIIQLENEWALAHAEVNDAYDVDYGGLYGENGSFAAEMEAQQKEFDEFEKEVEDTYNAMLELTERTAEKMQDNFSDIFYDGVTGELKSFADYADAIFKSVARAWSDIMGQMVAQNLFGNDFQGGGLLSGLGSLFMGTPGSSSMDKYFSFANGGYIGEEVIGKGKNSGKSYQFHPNEFVIPHNKLNQGGGNGNVQVKLVNKSNQELQASDAQASFDADTMILSVVLDGVSRNKMGMRDMMKGIR